MSSLDQGLTALGLSPTLNAPLMAYLKLLQKWNRAYNLTGIRDIDAMITRHVLDSLAIAPWLLGERILDVGSGAGLPGIPLAIAFPHLQLVLLDSNGKKVRFMQEAQRQLKLANVTVVQSRVETFQDGQGFSTITSRAFSEVKQMLAWTAHLLAFPGQWVLMKGHYPTTEVEALAYPYDIASYTVPGTTSERCCVIVKNTKTVD